MLPLIISPNPILRREGATIPTPLSPEIVDLAKEMFVAMKHYDGIGLAAPQIDQSIQLMVINRSGTPTAFFNPVILKKSWSKIDMEEGCLSVPGVFGIVRRPKKIYVRYYNIKNELKEEWIDAMVARIFQHEVDHLNGILFIDKTKKIIQGEELLKKFMN